MLTGTGIILIFVSQVFQWALKRRGEWDGNRRKTDTLVVWPFIIGWVLLFVAFVKVCARWLP